MTNYLQSSQQLQLDKQNYEPDYIHLYVDNIEGDWLTNWTWDDSFESNEWAAAFIYNVSKGKFKVALSIVSKWLKQL
jgi:hypothetical protein